MATVESAERITCPKCSRREAAGSGEELRCRRRQHAQRALELFKTRRLICEMLTQARRLERGGRLFSPGETQCLPTLVCVIGRNCDAAIENVANEAKSEHPDLAEGIRLLLDFQKCDGEARGGVGINNNGEQELQAIVTANVHQVDGETWQRLFKLRDGIAELLDDTPAERLPDEIPF